MTQSVDSNGNLAPYQAGVTTTITKTTYCPHCKKPSELNTTVVTSMPTSSSPADPYGNQAASN